MQDNKRGQITSHVQNIIGRDILFAALEAVFLLPLPLPLPLPSYALFTCMMRCDGVSLPAVSLSSMVSAALLREYDMLPSSNLHNSRTEQSRNAELQSYHETNTHPPSCQYIQSHLIFSIPILHNSFHLFSCHYVSSIFDSFNLVSLFLMSSPSFSSHLISSHLISSHPLSHLIPSQPIPSHLLFSLLITSHHITSHHITSHHITSHLL
jgi:hypothetical protein